MFQLTIVVCFPEVLEKTIFVFLTATGRILKYFMRLLRGSFQNYYHAGCPEHNGVSHVQIAKKG